MRTVDATLTAALQTGNYIPFATVHCQISEAVSQAHDCLFFELKATTCKVQFLKDTAYETCQYFSIERGVLIGGTEYSLTTSNFYLTYADKDERDVITFEGSLFDPRIHVSLDGNDTYENVIDAFVTEHSKTASFKRPTDAYWDYEFLPSGQFLDINTSAQFLSLIKQKYLLHAVDNGGDDILFYYPGLVFSSGSADWTLEPDNLLYQNHRHYRNLLSYDEDLVFTYAWSSGASAAYPVQNVGYIKSTDSKPSRSYPPDENSLVYSDQAYLTFTMRPDLRMQDGDLLYIASIPAVVWIQVKETWQARATPRWVMEISSVELFVGAGRLPAPTAAVAAQIPFAPLFTGHFDKILGIEDTTIQQAFETLDEHAHDTAYVKKTGDTMTGVLTVNAASVDVNSDTIYYPRFILTSGYNGAASGYVNFRKARTGYAAPAIVQSGDPLGQFIFQGYDGVAYRNAAGFGAFVSSTPGSGDMPGKLIFYTTPDGSTTVVSALDIDHNQMVRVAKGLYVGNDAGTGTDNDIICDGTIKTANGKEWDLGGYTAGAPTADGYLTVIVDGVTYKILVDKV